MRALEQTFGKVAGETQVFSSLCFHFNRHNQHTNHVTQANGDFPKDVASCVRLH